MPWADEGLGLGLGAQLPVTGSAAEWSAVRAACGLGFGRITAGVGAWAFSYPSQARLRSWMPCVPWADQGLGGFGFGVLGGAGVHRRPTCGVGCCACRAAVLESRCTPASRPMQRYMRCRGTCVAAEQVHAGLAREAAGQPQHALQLSGCRRRARSHPDGCLPARPRGRVALSEQRLGLWQRGPLKQ